MRGAGLGKALYKALFDQLETEAVHRCFAGITLPNEASLALHRAFGFEDVAVWDAILPAISDVDAAEPLVGS